jgi:hypothetical protein
MILKKYLAILFLVAAPVLYGQSGTPTETGSSLTVGRSASLGVEASTTFAWDIDQK